MKTLRGDLENLENNDDCRVLAPLVMTLFDGEADELEARRARAHLLVCQTCARRWLDWNRSRDLIQSAPVAAPPPQLLWRILIACRLASGAGRAVDKPVTSPLPTHLGAQILNRTTRAAQVQAPLLPRRSFSPLRISALAAPAAAVWLMVLQRDAWLPSPVFAPPVGQRQITPRMEKPRVAVSMPQTTAKSRAEIKVASSPRSDAIQPVSPPSRGRLASAEAPQQPERSLISTSVPRAIALNAAFSSVRESALAAPEQSDAPSPRSVAEVDLRRESRELKAESRRVASTSPVLAPRRQLVARLTATLTSSRTPLAENVAAPALRRARPVLTGTVSLPSAPHTLRVSLPTNSAPPAVRLLSENFDSDDARVDEIRSVVDDFRSALGSDDAAEGVSDDIPS